MVSQTLFSALPYSATAFDFSALSDERLLERWRHYAQVNTRAWKPEDRDQHWFEEECLWLEILSRGLPF